MLYVDSPMSGGVMGAEKGTLAFMVGANTQEDFEKASVVLEAMGKRVFHCGPAGTGSIAKLSNNLILGIQMAACSEGMALGEKLGIDPKILMNILAVSTSSCFCITASNPRPGNLPAAPSSNNYDGGFGVGLIRKDMGLALECAEAIGTDL